MSANKDITYPNALASSGKIVNVADPEFQDRTLSFTCLGCGEPMVAVHRTTGQSHFRHLNSNPDCNPQTYLHKLAKRKYKEWFDGGVPFKITYRSHDLCKHYDICCYREPGEEDKCYREGRHTVDLHSLYDTCTEETGYKGFIGDLVLTNSRKPEQEPLFLEIAVTHKCDEAKIASGIPIIELDIQSEEDIQLPISELGKVEAGIKPALIYNFDRSVPSEKIYDTHQIKSSSILCRYRNNYYWETQEGPCNRILSTYPQNRLCSLFFSKEDADTIGDTGLKELTWASSTIRGLHPHFCLFCNKARIKNPETGELGDDFCKTAKHDKWQSLNCPGFEFEPDVVKSILKKYETYNRLSIGFSKKDSSK